MYHLSCMLHAQTNKIIIYTCKRRNFNYLIWAVGSIWILNNYTGSGRKILLDTTVFKKLSFTTNEYKLCQIFFNESSSSSVFIQKKPRGHNLHNYRVRKFRNMVTFTCRK